MSANLRWLGKGLKKQMFSPSLHMLGRTVYHLPGKVTLGAPNAVLLLPGNLFLVLPAMCNLPFSVQAKRNGSVSNTHSPDASCIYTVFSNHIRKENYPAGCN